MQCWSSVLRPNTSPKPTSQGSWRRRTALNKVASQVRSFCYNRNDSEADSFLKAIIPGRDARSLERLPYWILVFRSAPQAASYQSRLRKYHMNAVRNLPVNPMQAALIWHRRLTPYAGYIDPASGKDVWAQLHEYCLLQPSQSFNVVALVPPFPPSILLAIERDEVWNGCREARSWTVLIRLDGGNFDIDDMCKFLEDDGNARHRPWDIVHKDLAGIPRHERSTFLDSMAVSKESHGCDTPIESQIFSVKFSSEDEAMRFWRTWHRMPLPHPADDMSAPEHQAKLLHVELTF